MTEELCEAYKDLDAKLDKLIDSNLSGIVDDASLSCLAALIQIERKLLPYHKELQNLEQRAIGDIGLVFGLISEKHLTPKEEQEIKRKLKDIKDVFNNWDGSKEDRDRVIAEIVGQIEDLLEMVSRTCTENPQAGN